MYQEEVTGEASAPGGAKHTVEYLEGAKVTLVLMYVAIKDAIENGTLTKVMLDSQKYSLTMIEKLWSICENGEKIEFAEQRLFGRVGNNWVPN